MIARIIKLQQQQQQQKLNTIENMSNILLKLNDFALLNHIIFIIIIHN